MKVTVDTSTLKKVTGLANSFFSKLRVTKSTEPSAFCLIAPDKDKNDPKVIARACAYLGKTFNIVEFNASLDVDNTDNTDNTDNGDNGGEKGAQQFIATPAKLLAKVLSTVKDKTVALGSVSQIAVEEDATTFKSPEGTVHYVYKDGEVRLVSDKETAQGLVQVNGKIFAPEDFGYQRDSVVPEDILDAARNTEKKKGGLHFSVPTFELEILMRNNQNFGLGIEDDLMLKNGMPLLELVTDKTGKDIDRLSVVTTNNHVLAVTSKGSARPGTVLGSDVKEIGEDGYNIFFSKEVDAFLWHLIKAVKPKQVGLHVKKPTENEAGFVGFLMQNRNGQRFELYVGNKYQTDGLVSLNHVMPYLDDCTGIAYNLREIRDVIKSFCTYIEEYDYKDHPVYGNHYKNHAGYYKIDVTISTRGDFEVSLSKFSESYDEFPPCKIAPYTNIELPVPYSFAINGSYALKLLETFGGKSDSWVEFHFDSEYDKSAVVFAKPGPLIWHYGVIAPLHPNSDKPPTGTYYEKKIASAAATTP